MVSIRINDPNVEQALKTELDKQVLKENGHLPVIKGSMADKIFIGEQSIGHFANLPAIVSISSKVHPHLESHKKLLVCIGLSEVSTQHSALLKASKAFTIRQMAFEGISEVCDAAMSSIRGLGQPFLLSINFDILDTYAYEKGIAGGISPRELIYLVQRLQLLKTFQKVELLGVNAQTIPLAVKLIRELS